MSDLAGDVTTRLWDSLEPYLDAEDVELDDLDVLGRGGGQIVRVTVDAVGGLGVDRIAALARGLSRLMDEEDLLTGSYTLEVSSPGLERPLRRPSHFAKSVGREVVVKTTDDVDGARSHRGILESVGSELLSVEVDGSARSIPMREVAQARTVFRWEKAPKPGHK